MTKTFKKAAALFMVLMVVLTSAPLQVFADEIPEWDETVMEDTETVKNEEKEEIEIVPEQETAVPAEETEAEVPQENPEQVEAEETPETEQDPSGEEQLFTEDEPEEEQMPPEKETEDPDETVPEEEVTQEEENPQEEETDLAEVPEDEEAEEEPQEEDKPEIKEIRLTVSLGDVRDLIRIYRNGKQISVIYGNPSPGDGFFYIAGPTGLEPMSIGEDGLTRLILTGQTGDEFFVETEQPSYARIQYVCTAEGTEEASGGKNCIRFTTSDDTDLVISGDYSGAEGFYAISVSRRALKAAGWALPDALYVSLGQAYDTYSSNAIVNGHRGVYFFQPEDLGDGRFVSATCGSTTKSMVSGVHYKVARIAELSARQYLDYGSGCCSQRAQRALAWITHHGQSEYDWNRANGNGFIMGDGKLSVANQLEAYTITFLAAWCCTNDGRQGTYGTVHAEDGAHALDFMFGSGFSTGLPASTKSAIDRMVAWGLAFADAHPNQDENIDEYQQTFVYSDGNGAHQPLLVGAYQGKKSMGKLKITKKSTMPECTNGNHMYSFEGTTFTVKNSSGTSVGTLTADASGKTKELELEPGTYTVTETKAGEGYVKDTSSKTVTVKDGETATVTFTNRPVYDPAIIGLVKWDSDLEDAVPQGDGSLQGAVYRYDYYDNLSWSGDPVRSWEFRTDENGEIRYLPEYKVSGPDLYLFDGWYYLPLGSLKITEVSPPEGYTAETREIRLQLVRSGDGVTEKWEDETSAWIHVFGEEFAVPEKATRGGVRFRKTDRETGEPVPGAEISVYSAMDNEIVVDGVRYKKDACVVTLVTGEDGTCKTSADLLPYGRYYAAETSPSEGYEINGDWMVEFEITGDGRMTDCATGKNILEEQVIRGNLMLLKTFEDGKPMADVPFLIVALDENVEEKESHVMVTDENGILDTSANRKNRTNSLDSCAEHGRFTDQSALDPGVGVWFGSSEPDEDLGALPYGMYKLYELQTDDLRERAIDLMESEMIYISEPNVTVQLPEMTNRMIRVRSAASVFGEKFMEEDEDVPVKDTVILDNLTPGRTYRVATEFVLRSDPGEILGTAEVLITPEYELAKGSPIGTEVTLETYIDTFGLAGEAVVAVDRVYEQIHGEEILVAEHYDLQDTEQTLWIPEIRTQAKDAFSGTREIQASESMRIVDTVEYRGLMPGVEYEISGMLVDKETGEYIESDDEIVFVDHYFTPKEENGTVDVVFELDGRDLAGSTVVVFENLLFECEIIASHEDIDDEAQSVNVIQIGTQAEDAVTGTHTASWSRKAEIIDTVSYEGLTPGRIYTLEGQIYVRSTDGMLIQNGEAVKAIVQFIPQEPDGEIDLTFIVDTEVLQGQVIVVFESLYAGYLEETGLNRPIAVHADIYDEGQTVEVPVRPREIVNTGDTGSIKLWGSLAVLSFAALGYLLMKVRKRK